MRDRLLRDATDRERVADEQRYSLLSILKRLFVAQQDDDDGNSRTSDDAERKRAATTTAALSVVRKSALRTAMISAADRGETHYDMSLGFNPLHVQTMASIHDPIQFAVASQYLCVEVLGSSRLYTCYRDDTFSSALCTVATRPALRISWADEKTTMTPLDNQYMAACGDLAAYAAVASPEKIEQGAQNELLVADLERLAKDERQELIKQQQDLTDPPHHQLLLQTRHWCIENASSSSDDRGAPHRSVFMAQNPTIHHPDQQSLPESMHSVAQLSSSVEEVAAEIAYF